MTCAVCEVPLCSCHDLVWAGLVPDPALNRVWSRVVAELGWNET